MPFNTNDGRKKRKKNLYFISVSKQVYDDTKIAHKKHTLDKIKHG
jgi:hypothetical protein